MIKDKFNIRAASDIVGIAPETIRHYERKGIVTPHISGSNNYRNYEMHDICILGRARAYRQYGFTLNEAGEMMSVPSMDFVTNKLTEKSKEIEQRIFKELIILNSIKDKLAAIQRARAEVGEFSIRNRPSMYAVHTFHNGIPLNKSNSKGKSAEWYGNQTITFPIWIFDGERFNNNDTDDFDVYIAVLEADSGSFDKEIHDFAEHLPSCSCLHVTTMTPFDEDRRTTFTPIVEYMKKNHMRASGNVIWQTISGCAYENSFIYYRDLWIPIV